MPFILRNQHTGEVKTDHLINSYELRYYGVCSWEEHEEAEAAREGQLAEISAEEKKNWEIFELEEHDLKLCNVKLKNDSRFILYVDASGKPSVIKSSS